MPLARIFTDHPEQLSELIAGLHAMGYVVECAVAGADVSARASAELEIAVESCSPGDALARAKAIAGEIGADVFVASGAFAAPARAGGEKILAQPKSAPSPAERLTQSAPLSRDPLTSAQHEAPEKA